MHPMLQRTFDVDDVEPELKAALDIVERLDPPEDLRLAAFNIAAQLLTQRAQAAQVGSVQLPAGLLGH